MQVNLRQLYHNISAQEFCSIIREVTPETWQRWLDNKDTYYKMCKKHINYAVAHYASRTPIPPKDIEGEANLIFCIACLRWDPNGSASLPTYVAHQLGYLSGYLVRREASHRHNVTSIETESGPESILDILGKVDPDNSLLEYIEKAGPDVLSLYKAIQEGYYTRKTQSGASRPISAIGLYRSKVLGWNSILRYQAALKGLKRALDAWRCNKDYKGYAVLRPAAV